MRQKAFEKLQASPFSSRSIKQILLMKKQLPQNIKRYLLQDYTFLNEYQLLDSSLNSEYEFLARIKSTQQLVKFKKKPFLPVNTARGESMYKRFQAMYALFQKGIILADNIFILQQANKQYFYYIIQPYLSRQEVDSPFVTLQQYLFENRESSKYFQARKNVFIKCKNLLDNLSLYEQSYCGLNSRKIVIDDEENAFLLPFQLQTQVMNKPYERSYYPIQVLKFLQQQQNGNKINSLHKWDLWSFGCITLDIFLYLTPYFLSTSIQKQTQRIQKQTCNIFKDFQAKFINYKKSIQNLNQQLKHDQLEAAYNLEEDKQKILNFLMNVFHENQDQRKFSFQPIRNENQSYQTERQRRSSRVKSSTRRLFEKTIQKSKEKISSKTERNSSIVNVGIQSSRIFPSSKQQVNDFKQLNVCQKINNNKQKSTRNDGLYTLELKIKSLIIQDFPIAQERNHREVKIVVIFYNGEKFQFFINLFKQSQQSQININRKITFTKRQMQFLQNLLEQDIQVLLSIQNDQQNQEKQAEILINLSALTIKNESGERMWKKPIKGSYSTQKSSDFQCKIKIQAQILGKDQKENKLTKTRNKIQSIHQQQTVKDIEPFNILKESSKTTNLKNIQKDQNSQQKQMTSRFEDVTQQKLTEKANIQVKPKKSSFSKFSSINSQLDEISSYWKQKIQIDQQQQQSDFKQQIKEVCPKIIQTENILKERKFEQNPKVVENLLNQEGKSLQKRVKKILQQNTKVEKFTQPIDLTKKLKRLLMK